MPTTSRGARGAGWPVWFLPPRGRLGGGAFLLAILVLCAVASAQSTTQPASLYDAKPIKRSPASSAQSEQATAAPQTFDWSRLAMAMAIVIGLIFALRFAMAKLYPGVGASKAGRAVRVLSRSPIAPKQQVMLLQVGRRVIVVGDSGGQLSSLSEITDPDEVASLVGQIENVESAPVASSRFSKLVDDAQEAYVEEEKPPAPPGEEAVEIEQAQSEISGLIERMRLLTRQVRRE